jgi:hypothetical protein
MKIKFGDHPTFLHMEQRKIYPMDWTRLTHYGCISQDKTYLDCANFKKEFEKEIETTLSTLRSIPISNASVD